MNILVTGSDGFIGRNLIENLKNIRDGKNRTRPGLKIDRVIGYDVSHAAGTPADASKGPADVTADLETCCADADFVFHFAENIGACHR